MKAILPSLWACCTPAVFRFSRIICAKVCPASYAPEASATLSISWSSSSTASTYEVEALDGERAGDTDRPLSS